MGGELAQAGPLTYTVVDALSKLFLLLVRLADKEAGDMTVREGESHYYVSHPLSYPRLSGYLIVP